MHVLLIALLTVPAFAAQTIAPARPPDPATMASIHSMMDSMAAQNMFRGNVLISYQGAVRFNQSYGLANIEWQQKNVPESKFRLGSLTKVLTSMLILTLAQNGKIDLEKHVTDYLPDYRRDTGSRITVAQLLDHSSGLPNYTDLPDFPHLISRIKLPTQEFITRYCQTDLLFPPGTSYSYSNTGYFLLGAISEAVTGQTYDLNMEQYVFKPLGMSDSGYGWNQAVLPQFAYGYEQQGCDENVAAFAEMSVPFSAGALYSTTGDLNKMNVGIINHTVLNPTYTAIMFKPRICEMNCQPAPGLFPDGVRSAYGWDHEFLAVPPAPNNGVPIWSKLGSLNGYVNYIVRTPDFFVAVLSNQAEAYSSYIALAITQILYGAPPKLVTPQMSSITAIQQTICKSGLAAAVAQIKANPPATPSTLSAIGNSFVGTYMESNVTLDQASTASTLFELNYRLFPQQPSVYQDLILGYTKKSAVLPLTLDPNLGPQQ
ncbi:MAG TPA: serine hydrolase domain-containing protein [Thermoanaerobaculia bacterium]|nr:serine hydrolase domain-containing protein [Thermoanaerobaculia bacterium]